MNLPSLVNKKRKPPGLMLTPLLDMFTIVLIFLLVSFEAEDYEFKMAEGVTPAQSTAQSIFKPGVNVAIAMDGVTIEEDRLLPLRAGAADDAAYAVGFHPTLVQRFKDIYEERFAFNDLEVTEYEDPEEAPDEEEVEVDDAILIIQAHRDLDYRTIHLVMNSAREAGFYKYRLAVVRK